MTAQGNVGARPLSEEPVPTDDPAQGAGPDTRTSRFGADARGGDAMNPLLWERFLHNLMTTLGAWTI